jgi:hypothetical protein
MFSTWKGQINSIGKTAGMGKLITLLNPAKPVTRPPTMGSNDQNFNIRTDKAIQDVVRKTWNPESTDAWRKFDVISIRGIADCSHCRIESHQVTPPSPTWQDS